MTRSRIKTTTAPTSDPLAGLTILAGDFETFYSKEYGLRVKGMSTSLYVRDKRFKPHCLAVRSEKDPYPTVHYGYDGIKKFVKTVDWKKTAFLAHHQHFDGLILTHHFGVKPAFWLDTLSMARALHGSGERNDLDSLLKRYGFEGKLNDVLKHMKGVRDPDAVLASMQGDYAKQDVSHLLELFRLMRPNFPNPELRKIDVFIRMFTEPVLQVNRKLAAKEYRAQIRERDEKIEAGGEEIDDLRSRETFAELLQSRGVTPPMKTKIRKKTGEKYQTFAFAKTDRAFQELKADPRVADLVEAKLAASSTIGETRAEGMLERSERGMRLPIYLNYAKAHTLRTSGGDNFNPQNFPARGGEDTLKRCIIAPKGYRLVVADSAQIEFRENAWLSGQEDVLQAFREKRDLYAEQASDIYKMPIDKKKNPEERFIGKTTTLGCGYQMSGAKFQITLAMGTMGPPVFIGRDLADEAVASFRRKNYKIAANWSRMQNLIAQMANGVEYEYKCLRFVKGGIEMPNGLMLRYPALRWREARNENEYDGWVYGANEGKSVYGGLLTENVIQSLSYITVSDQMLEIARGYQVVMFTHDEIVFLAKNREADAALKYAIAEMTKAPKWAPDLPLAAEGHHDVMYRKPE